MVLSVYPTTILPTQRYQCFQKCWAFAPLQGHQALPVLFRILIFSKEWFFSESNEDPPKNDTQSGSPFEHKSFKLKSSLNPVGPFQLEYMFCSIEQDLHRKNGECRKKNLTKEEYKAIRSLKHNKEIIIKPADKGSVIVIMDKISYFSEGQKQLSHTQFYEQTDTDLTQEVMHRVNLHVHGMLQKGQISQSTCSYLTIDIDRTQQFYLLPKIHKNPPGRPIISLRQWRSYRKDITIYGSLYMTFGTTLSILYPGTQPI